MTYVHAALAQARRRLAEHREQRARAERSGQAAEGNTLDTDPDHVDVEAANAQTLTLLRLTATVVVAGLLWAVWRDLLPALALLKQVQLTDPTYGADGNEVIVEAITLWSLILGAGALALTAVAARNLPAVLELLVLRRFPIDAGTRYAATTLLRYVTVAVGVVVASRLLGIDWSRAQWIVAALGVGLGFGLQEIVANFVSGLIILFERPVRVGDVVTVGEVEGTVTRLQIRATTLTDFENKEVLVPNKSFITDRVSNWTLSSSVTRLLVRVGVAYGSDVSAAEAAIKAAVAETPDVLAEPASSVFFLGFGESSLDFEIRAFVGQTAHRLSTTHALHTNINKNLAEAGIEIPFPQRVIHAVPAPVTPQPAADGG